MIRTTGAAMMLMATIIVAGCTKDLSSSAHERVTTSEQTQVLEPLSSPQAQANILLFGDLPSIIHTLRVRLQTLGHTVTVRVDFSLPDTLEELVQYDTIWHVGRAAALPAARQALLVAYLAVGGGLHLTGEAVGADIMNDSLTAFVRAVVNNGSGITIGRQGAVRGPVEFFYYPVNANVAGGVASSPNTVENLELMNAGGIGGLPLTSPNVLATGRGAGGDRAVAAIWPGHELAAGAGKLSIIMDSEWLTRLNASNDNAALVQNLQEFLTGNIVWNWPPHAVAVLPPGQNLVCNGGSGDDRMPVGLDGSGSTDPDSAPQPLTYTWFENGEDIATGPTPTVNLTPGNHVITLLVSDGEKDSLATVTVQITLSPGHPYRCNPGAPCRHGEGDCDTDADCRSGLVCLLDVGYAFGYLDPELDVCSTMCPTLGVGAWNYCSRTCPCDAGEGDCHTDADCAPRLRCVQDIGPAFGFPRGVDICEPT
jgi:hypothetical protein